MKPIGFDLVGIGAIWVNSMSKFLEDSISIHRSQVSEQRSKIHALEKSRSLDQLILPDPFRTKDKT